MKRHAQFAEGKREWGPRPIFYNTCLYLHLPGPFLTLSFFFPSAHFEQALLLACAQGLGILASAPLFDRCGRRALFLVSCVGSGVFIGLVSVAFALGVEDNQSLALGGLVGYLVAFGLGLGPGPWVVRAIRLLHFQLLCTQLS